MKSLKEEIYSAIISPLLSMSVGDFREWIEVESKKKDEDMGGIFLLYPIASESYTSFHFEAAASINEFHKRVFGAYAHLLDVVDSSGASDDEMLGDVIKAYEESVSSEESLMKYKDRVAKAGTA